MRLGLHRGLMLGLMMTGGILNYADRQSIAVLKPMLQGELGWSDADYGWLTSVFQFAAAISLLGAGWLIDRTGWRLGNPLAVGSWSLAAVFHGLVSGLTSFTVVRVALGATEALGTPASIKTIAIWFRASERSFILGIANASATAGAILTPVIVPMMALAFGWRAVFVITGGLGLVWVLFWFAMVSLPYFRTPPEQEAPDAIERVGWLAVLADRRTWAIAGAKALSDQVWWFLLFWMPDLFTRVFHLDMHSFGVPLGVIYTFGAIGSLVGGYIPGRMLAAGASIDQARKRAMLVSAVLVLLAAPLVLAAENYWVAVGLLGLVLAAHQGFSVNLFATATDIVPSSRVGSVVSFGAFCGNMAGMLVLQLAGHVLATTGSYAPMFGLIAVAYLLALGWLHLLLPTLRAAGAEMPAMP